MEPLVYWCKYQSFDFLNSNFVCPVASKSAVTREKGPRCDPDVDLQGWGKQGTTLQAASVHLPWLFQVEHHLRPGRPWARECSPPALCQGAAREGHWARHCLPMEEPWFLRRRWTDVHRLIYRESHLTILGTRYQGVPSANSRGGTWRGVWRFSQFLRLII